MPTDHGEAMKWFTWAAEKGFAPAQYALGTLLRVGWTPPAALISVPVTELHEPLTGKQKAARQRSRCVGKTVGAGVRV